MSIAKDEAEEIYPYRWKNGKRPDYIEDKSDIISEHLAVIPHIKSTDLQNAYVAGRTAEPTETETWIIARALYEHYADLEFCSEVSDDEWERYKCYYGKTPMQCTEFIRAKKALDAARKAVTE